MSGFLEAAAAYIKVKKEKIYLNEDIISACRDITKLLIKQLNEHGIELSENEASMITDDYFDEILNQLDLIVVTAYFEGFVDSTKFHELLKELK